MKKTNLTIKLDEQIVGEAFRNGLRRVLSGAETLPPEAGAELDRLVEELAPLAAEYVRAAATDADPRAAAAYLEVLNGAVWATSARLGLRLLAARRTMIADVLTTTVQIVAAILKGVVVAL